MLTLTGPGGCGKTRLALQVAWIAGPAYEDGARLVELAALTNPELLPQTIATVLGVREEAGCSWLQSLIDYMRTRQMMWDEMDEALRQVGIEMGIGNV